ncbi:glucose-6-phosphate isomerase family protein [Bacteroides sp.]|uniref:glucose-6-phosphate isomerase family protein n=1 Tax=Bacteroides sp. TaxID=29523 RepID=UPI0026035C5A|nr:glucose-6-phosphate isomerase family protein [Bacteroides sp.]
MDNRRIYVPSSLFMRDYLVGEEIQKNSKTLADLQGIFHNVEACQKMSPETLLYEVSCYLPVQEGLPGGLYFGITKIFSGKVGDEYFMTKGHFHANIDRGEYYWGIEGEGVLILMDQNRCIWGEQIFPGSLHYIPGGVAHRVANVGTSILSFAACWPSDAGHNYQEILDNGFSASLQCINGNPELIAL